MNERLKKTSEASPQQPVDQRLTEGAVATKPDRSADQGNLSELERLQTMHEYAKRMRKCSVENIKTACELRDYWEREEIESLERLMNEEERLANRHSVTEGR